MMMVGRQYIKDELHRYAFNGKEYDNYVVQYDYGFRIYDPRICRFLSVDPLTQSYPWYTAFQFAGNNPIWAIDLDGLEEEKVNDNTGPSNPNDAIIENKYLEDITIKTKEKGIFEKLWTRVKNTVKHVTVFALATANAYASDNMLGAGRIDPTIFGDKYTNTAKIGQKTGDIIALASGIRELIQGGTGLVLGTGLKATGVGAPAGVGVDVISGIFFVHGYTTTKTAWNNLLKAESSNDAIHDNPPEEGNPNSSASSSNSGNYKTLSNNKSANDWAKSKGFDDAHDLKRTYAGHGNESKFDLQIDSKSGKGRLISKDQATIIDILE